MLSPGPSKQPSGSEREPPKSKVPFSSLLSALKKHKRLQASTATVRGHSGSFPGAWAQLGHRRRLLRNAGQDRDPKLPLLRPGPLPARRAGSVSSRPLPPARGCCGPVALGDWWGLQKREVVGAAAPVPWEFDELRAPGRRWPLRQVFPNS